MSRVATLAFTRCDLIRELSRAARPYLGPPLVRAIVSFFTRYRNRSVTRVRVRVRVCVHVHVRNNVAPLRTRTTGTRDTRPAKKARDENNRSLCFALRNTRPFRFSSSDGTPPRSASLIR